MSCKDSILTTIGILEGKATTALNKAKASEDAWEVQSMVREAAQWLQAAEIVRKNHKVDEPVAQITRREEHHYHYPRWNVPYTWKYTTEVMPLGMSYGTTLSGTATNTSASYRVNLDTNDPDYNVLKLLSDHLAS